MSKIELRKKLYLIDLSDEYGDTDNVKKSLQEGIKESTNTPGYNDIFLSYEAFYLEDNKQSALEYADKAVSISKKEGFILATVGCLLLGSNKNLAIAYAKEAIEKFEYEEYYTLHVGKLLMALGQYKNALKYFDMVFEFEENEFLTLLNKGICLSKIGRPERSIGYYKRALKIKKTIKLYNLIGVAYNKLGPHDQVAYDSAIDILNEGLNIFPDNAKLLNEKGSAISDKYKNPCNAIEQKEAISIFNKSLEIERNNPYTLRNIGIAYYRINQFLESFNFLLEASTWMPNNPRLQNDLSFIYSMLSNQEKMGINPDIKIDQNNRGFLEGFIEIARRNFKDEIDKFNSHKERYEKKLETFMTASSRIKDGFNFFLSLRRWNSYTPAIPLDDGEKSIGGGYYFYHNGTGTVIDPGYNFIENFFHAKCRLRDIDNIIITHAHNDHTMDFESLLSLFYQINKGEKLDKKIKLYLNPGSLIKFSSFINFRSKNIASDIYCLNPRDNFPLDSKGSMLTVLPAFHDEIITKYKSVGLHISFDFDGDTRQVILTSDTGLYPLCENALAKHGNCKIGSEIYNEYKSILGSNIENIDMLIAHLGSLGKSELKSRNFSLEAEDWHEYTEFYENHLGVLGVLLTINFIKPKFALISEFGEELKQFRYPLIKLIQKTLSPARQKVLPADLSFIYDLHNQKGYCPISEEMIDINNLYYHYNKFAFYYSSKPTEEISDEEKEKIIQCKKFPYLR